MARFVFFAFFKLFYLGLKFFDLNKLWMGLHLQVSMDLSKAFSDFQPDFTKGKLCPNSFTMNVLQLICSYFSKR